MDYLRRQFETSGRALLTLLQPRGEQTPCLGGSLQQLEDLWAEAILHGTKVGLIYLDRPICRQLLHAPVEDVYNRPILASPPHLQEALGQWEKVWEAQRRTQADSLTRPGFPYAAGL